MTLIAVLVSILLATVTSSLSKKFMWTIFFFLSMLHLCILNLYATLNGSDMPTHVQSTSKKADVAATAAAAAKKEVERGRGRGRKDTENKIRIVYLGCVYACVASLHTCMPHNFRVTYPLSLLLGNLAGSWAKENRRSQQEECRRSVGIRSFLLGELLFKSLESF